MENCFKCGKTNMYCICGLDKELETMENIKKEAGRLIGLFYPNAYIDEKSEKSKAKQCALICLDEIINNGCTRPSIAAYYGDNEEATLYWQQVKQYIKDNY